MHNVPGNNNLSLLLKNNISPHDYALKLKDIKAIKSADLIIWVGEDLECFLVKLFKDSSLVNNLLTVQLLGGIHKLPCRNSNQLDEHLWLYPKNASVIVESIAKRLIELDPVNTNKYLVNKQNFLIKIANNNNLINNKLSNIKHKNYVVFHDAYQYFEKFYGLNAPLVISDHPELPLSAKKMLDINLSIKQNNIQCIFKEPQFDPKIINFLQNKNKFLKIGCLDPLGMDKDLGPDGYFKLLNNLADALSGCLEADKL